jgi:hypothetical protein
MPRGGPRKPTDGKKLGRPARERTPAAVDKGVAAEILALPEDADRRKLRPEVSAWHEHIWDRNAASRLTDKAYDSRKYLTDKRDGKPVQNLNHIHKEPQEINVNLSISEIVRKVRQRKAEYERSR